MNLRNLKIRNRLIIGFSIIIILSGLIGFISLRNFQKSSDDLEQMYLHPFTVSNAVRDINTNIISIHRSMKDVALATSDTEINNIEGLINEYEKETYALFDVVFDRFLGDKKDVTTSFQLFKQWKPIREEVIALWHANNKEGAALITKGKGAIHVNNILASVDVMIEFANNKGDEFYTLTQENERKTYNSLFYLLLIVIIISLTIATTITRSILKAITNLNLVSNKIQSGDYTVRNIIKSNDELSHLAATFNNMADAIESRNSITSGVAAISSAIVGKDSIEDFASSLIAVFKKKTLAQMATFHLLNEDKNEFEHVVSIGANKKTLNSFSAKHPEGEFGNACSRKKIYHLKNVSKNTIFKYNTVAGKAIPKEIITIPIIVNNQVIALISLVNLNEFSTESCEIITQTQEPINTSFATIFANEQAKIFAQKLVVSNQQLEAQSEELQEQTEELQNQSNELRMSSEELNEQNLELQMQRRQVEEATRLKSEFLSNMSHELRTPLNSINALSKVLMIQSAEKLSEDENKYLEIIERNGKRLLTLINDILDLSKIEAGKMEVDLHQFALKPSIELITENLKSLASEKDIQLNLAISEDLPAIESDENRLHQVLTNIIGNAIKFTHEGEVNVTAFTENGNAVIRVQDTGIGMDADILPYIFKEFRQEDGSTSRSFEGTGLGLAIANKIIQALNGEIKVESNKGIGSTFTISLPIKSNFEESTVLETFKTPFISPKKKLILVVDDEVKSIQQLSKSLDAEGYQTIGASTGKEALRLAEKHQPFAITLDIAMPDMDGWEVLLKLQANEATKDIPVIVVSKTDDINTGQALGAIGYIQKPVNKQLLIQEINKVAESPVKVMVVDDSEIDSRHISDILKKENIENILASNGQQCLNELKTEKPDVLILDLMMPEMDGFQVLSAIRSEKSTQDLPVIVVTAKDLTSEDKAKLQGKATSILTKGVLKPDNLLIELKRILGNIAVKKSPNRLKPTNGKKRLLLIEDSEAAIIQIQKVVAHENIIIDFATNGIEALQYIETTIPDGIILDLMMPEMDGFETLEKIRGSAETKDIPVLVLTAKTLTKSDLSKLSSNNVKQLIQKGDVNVKELLAKINAMIGIEITPPIVPAKIKTTPTIITKTPIKINKGKKPTIVLVEDNPDNRITAKAILGDGFTIIEAVDGEDGLQKIAQEIPDLVLLDISLPKKDGIEVVKMLKENEKTKGIPVIALTAKAMKKDREIIMEAGCDEYVSKPIDVVELRSKIAQFIKA